jgi:hypothetical protein
VSCWTGVPDPLLAIADHEADVDDARRSRLCGDQEYRRPHDQQLREGDLALLFNSSLQRNRHTKLNDNWRLLRLNPL